METVYFLIPIALLLGAVGLGFFIWAVKSGQYDDLEGPAHRILFEDDRALLPGEEKEKKAPEPGSRRESPTP